MDNYLKTKIDEANLKAVEIMMKGQPIWIADRPAIDVIPGMTKNTVLHAGPPIEWERMCNPQKQGVLGAVIFEGLASSIAEAEEMVKSGEIILAANNDHQTVGGMTGVTSASMPVHVIKNETYGNFAYCMDHEGSSFRGLGWGTWDDETIRHVRWLADEFAPVLSAAVQAAGGINVNELINRSIQMGDEGHTRCVAGTLIIIQKLASFIAEMNVPKETIRRVFEFLNTTYNFALHVFMAGARSIVEPAKNIPYSTVVTTLSRNGVEFGIKVSALGDQWFTGPAQKIRSVFFSSEWNDSVATPDIGDSAIMETIGLGGAIQVNAPAHAHVFGGTFASALNTTEQAYRISVSEHSSWLIPNLDFRGTPIGIDIRKVVQSGITPTIDTATAHVEGGFIGTGESNPPIEVFESALRAFSELAEVKEAMMY